MYSKTRVLTIGSVCGDFRQASVSPVYEKHMNGSVIILASSWIGVEKTNFSMLVYTPLVHSAMQLKFKLMRTESACVTYESKVALSA